MGTLRSWGRKIDNSRRLPLAEIPKEYWMHATFTYYFLDDPEAWGARSSEGIDYADLRTSRAQALANFFLPIQDAAVIAYEAAEGTLYGRLNDRLSKTPEARMGHHISAFLNRNMNMLGKSPPSTKLRPIPAADKPQLRWVEGSNSLKSQFAGQPGRYDDVMVSRADLYEYCEYLKRIGGTQF
jgi:hypothetical protein